MEYITRHSRSLGCDLGVVDETNGRAYMFSIIRDPHRSTYLKSSKGKKGKQIIGPSEIDSIGKVHVEFSIKREN